MNIRELKDKEVQHWKRKYERTVRLCKAIYEYAYQIEEIKGDLYLDDTVRPSEMWNELDYEVQKLLITAPLYGGPFTTEERKKIKELWEVHSEDIG